MTTPTFTAALCSTMRESLAQKKRSDTAHCAGSRVKNNLMHCRQELPLRGCCKSVILCFPQQILLAFTISSIIFGCDKGTAGNSEAPKAAALQADHQKDKAQATESKMVAAKDRSATASPPAPRAACLAPFSTQPAPAAFSASSCPDDPNGRPKMPRATVSFKTPKAEQSLDVEWALTREHQAHGLMYRKQLADHQP